MRDRLFHQRPYVCQQRVYAQAVRLAGCICLLLPLLGLATIADAARAEARIGASPSVEQNSKDLPPWVDGDPISLSPDEALWAALAFEDADKVRAILDRGASANKPESLSQMTPLMAAETLPVTLALLERGADPRARDRTGRTPLHYAVTMRDAAKIIPVLVRRGSDVDARTEDAGRDTPLMLAVENYIDAKDEKSRETYSLLIRELVHLGADIGAADARGKTPMAMAAIRNQPDLIRLLIELGADPARPTTNGRTPLDYAREANAKDAMQLLAGATSKSGPAN